MHNSKEYLTICNSCQRLMIDGNPGGESIDVSEYGIAVLEETEYVTDDGGFPHGCGECDTDGYLEDITEDNICDKLDCDVLVDLRIGGIEGDDVKIRDVVNAINNGIASGTLPSDTNRNAVFLHILNHKSLDVTTFN